MDVTGNFFTKLRNLAVTLEKESKHLEQALNNESVTDHEEAPMRILYEMHSEVRNIKVDFNNKLETLNLQWKQNSEFIRAFQLLHKRFSGELEIIQEHFQKYGYKPLNLRKDEEEPPMGLTNGETENFEDTEEKSSEVSTTPPKKPSLNDPLNTPHMEDFGIGHLMLQNTWRLPQNMQTPVQKVTDKDHMKVRGWVPTLPKTPKCTLHLDDEFLCTPKMEDFGITEHTACVNDFTMELYNKSDQPKLDRRHPIPATRADEQTMRKRTADIPAISFMKQQKVHNTVELLNSPLPPVFCTPGLKIHKKQIPVFSHTPEDTERSSDLLPSPSVPNFETLWMKRKCTQLHLKDEETAEPVEKPGSDRFSSEEPEPPIIKSPLPLPKMTNYDHLLNTPQAPEMNMQMSDNVLKILSSYNVNRMTSHDMNTRHIKSSCFTSVGAVTPVSKKKPAKEN
ncbi:spindle and kinetochore-associated protein 3 [Callorhinchus milii]|nr:spindle and kinetochore-associated protein 3 [Callorhinchus milii]|eukprot:gi/632965373/ref/XP_007898858.1/ PREDICTED: spindle and kinetochore-associated protein 3 [Callorhinchus milii]